MQNKINTKFGKAIINKGYYRINSGEMLHRLIWEDWYGKPVPKGYFIHHLNHNKLDNRIQNLQCVESKLHRKYHSSNISEETKKKMRISKLGEKNPNYNKSFSNELREKMGKPKRGILLSEEHREKLSKSHNTTGYLNVSKNFTNNYKKGFCWRYTSLQDGKRIDIRRGKLGDLEKEVKRRNLKWEYIGDGGVLNIV